MPPTDIYIIRHCDKPSDYTSQSVLNQKPCLCTEQGYLRAKLLPGMWKKLIKNFNADSITIFASAFSPDNPDCNCEQREMLVIIPTANVLGVKVNMPCCFTEVNYMATIASRQKGIVIIAWEHHNIPPLLQALGFYDVGLWPENRYDIVFHIDVTHLKLTAFTQGLNLPGDSDQLPPDYQKYATKSNILTYGDTMSSSNVIIYLIIGTIIILVIIVWLVKMK